MSYPDAVPLSEVVTVVSLGENGNVYPSVCLCGKLRFACRGNSSVDEPGKGAVQPHYVELFARAL